jgi:hypothetical protein
VEVVVEEAPAQEVAEESVATESDAE